MRARAHGSAADIENGCTYSYLNKRSSSKEGKGSCRYSRLESWIHKSQEIHHKPCPIANYQVEPKEQHQTCTGGGGGERISYDKKTSPPPTDIIPGPTLIQSVCTESYIMRQEPATLEERLQRGGGGRKPRNVPIKRYSLFILAFFSTSSKTGVAALGACRKSCRALCMDWSLLAGCEPPLLELEVAIFPRKLCSLAVCDSEVVRIPSLLDFTGLIYGIFTISGNFRSRKSACA